MIVVIKDVGCAIKINELKKKSTYMEDDDAYKGLQEAFTYKYYQQSSHLGLRDSPHAK